MGQFRIIEIHTCMAPRLKEIKQVHENVYETFDFTDNESVMILRFYLKASKKTVVSIRTRKNLLSGNRFSEKVGGRLPNKKGRRTGWSKAKPEFVKIKVDQKRVNVVLQDL